MIRLREVNGMHTSHQNTFSAGACLQHAFRRHGAERFSTDMQTHIVTCQCPPWS